MFKIYWTAANHEACSQDEALLTNALEFVRAKRNAGYSFVTMVAEDSNQVGKPGVDAIANGKTPDGQVYEWSKAGRAGKPRKDDKLITAKDYWRLIGPAPPTRTGLHTGPTPLRQ